MTVGVDLAALPYPERLAALLRARVGVFVPDFLDDVVGLFVLFEEGEGLRAVGDIDDGLGGGDAGFGIGPEDAVADGEDAGLDSAADFAGVGVEAEDGEGSDGGPGEGWGLS